MYRCKNIQQPKISNVKKNAKNRRLQSSEPLLLLKHQPKSLLRLSFDVQVTIWLTVNIHEILHGKKKKESYLGIIQTDYVITWMK